jgi:antitoxin component YwqK of YwqJK toxin-antitoxin module
MKLFSLLIIFLFSSLSSFSQVYKDNVLYVVDSIAITGFYSDFTIADEDIASIYVETERKLIRAAGFSDADKVCYIITKSFANRSDSVKAIPRVRNMSLKKGLYYLKHEKTPYSGPIIDFHLNGKLSLSGSMENGFFADTLLFYGSNQETYGFRLYNKNNLTYKEIAKLWNHSLYYMGDFKNDKPIGKHILYYTNGRIRIIRNYDDNSVLEGLYEEYYSSGILKSQMNYTKGTIIMNEKDNTIDKLFTEYYTYKRQGDIINTLATLDKIIEVDSNNINAYNKKGECLLEILKCDEAITCFSKSIEIEPLSSESYKNHVFAYVKKYESLNSKQPEKIDLLNIDFNLNAIQLDASVIKIICDDIAKIEAEKFENNHIKKIKTKFCR